MQTNRRHTRRALVGMLLIIAVALTGLALTGPEPLSAQDSAANLQQSVQTQTSGAGMKRGADYSVVAGSMARMISALIIVILCIYLGLYALKRMMMRRRIRSGVSDALEVIQTAWVGPKKSVALVKFANRSVLVGVTDSRISVLSELSEKETGEILAVNETPVDKPAFGNLLSQAVARVQTLRPTRRKALVQA